jgi:hypothetical protein
MSESTIEDKLVYRQILKGKNAKKQEWRRSSFKLYLFK